MKIVDMTATGDDNILSDEEKHDLEYRKAQLQRLQEEVVDIEEMSSEITKGLKIVSVSHMDEVLDYALSKEQEG